jgi:cytochrome c
MKVSLLVSSLVLLASTSISLAGDAASGESTFKKKCATCHMVGADAKNSAGPLLNSIVGSKIASVEGFKYGKSLSALGETGAVWTEEELDKWLKDQKKYVRAALDDKKAKAKMNVKIKKDDERADLVAYLATLSQ